jgi:uncharacterized protein (TIGR01777 family)
MRVLVTGGTGFIGKALVQALRSRGDEPVVVSRTSSSGTVPWESVSRAIESVDAVVNLAGEPIADRRWTRERLAQIRESRVRATERLAGAIEGASRRPSVMVSGSAIGIYGMRNDAKELDETSPTADDVLARIVVDWEKAADPVRRAGVRVVHPRTGVVLGAGGGALAKMVAPFRFFVGGPVGDGDQWVSWVHLRDTVRALLFVLDTPSLSGPVNVTAPRPVTMEALAQAIGAALHRPSGLRVPPLALRLALGAGLADVLLTGQRVLPRKLLDAGFAFEITDIEEACREILS